MCVFSIVKFYSRLNVKTNSSVSKDVLNPCCFNIMWFILHFIFVFQEQVLEESNKYKDLIQDLSFVDSYYNLTLKVVTMLRLVDRHCGDSTKYLMKIDDDMFLHVGRLVQVLKDRNDSSNILIGKLLTDAKPIRYSSNKW